MDIRFLNTFLEVAKTRHFGRAAENLYLTQSAVSARIKLLEEYFNTALFIRNRNSIQITPAGEKLIPFSKELARTLDLARKSLAEEDCQYISSSSTQNAFLLFFSSLMPELINTFKSLTFRNEIASIEQITRQLHEHSIDFALATSQVKSDGINSQLLFEVPLCLYQSKHLLENETSSEITKVCDINIDWTSPLNDKLVKVMPDMRRAKLRTASLDMGLSLAKSTRSRVVMPAVSHPMLDLKFKDELSQFDCSTLDAALTVPVYLNQLKNQSNKSVEKVTTFMKLAVSQRLNQAG